MNNIVIFFQQFLSVLWLKFVQALQGLKDVIAAHVVATNFKHSEISDDYVED